VQQWSIFAPADKLNSMFLKDLWLYNKKVTLAFLLFILLWLFFNVKQGAVATPILHYSMFSENYHLRDTQNIVQLFINNRPVDFSTISVSGRDQLQVSLENYSRQQQTNEVFFNTMQGILNRVRIGQWMKKEFYTNSVTDQQFTDWYKHLAERITGGKIFHLSAFQQKFVLQNGRLTPIASPVKLTGIVAF
jgi:methionine-rich copper-binding protein CopC